jgi:uncharacterized membrane protein YraQ (UPF0718 family)
MMPLNLLRHLKFPARLAGWAPLLTITLLVLAALLNWAGLVLGGLPLPLVILLDRLSSFGVVFLSIFIEAAPFLLLGSLAAGLVEEFVSRDDLAHWIPRGAVPGALVGGLIGLFFPVCECGVVPFARRLMGKGLPVSSAVAVLLAAPAVNPIVIASTFAAYGNSPIFWGRIGFSFVIAVATGVLFARFMPDEPLRAGGLNLSLTTAAEIAPPDALPIGMAERLRHVLVVSADEFFEMGRYLVIGAALAALMQTFLSQSVLLAIGNGPVLSVLVMLLLAVLLSICSTVDAFISLAFVGTFSSGAILAFLVFGPMVDIKSTLMYLRLFKTRPTALLVLLPFVFSLVLGIVFNLVAR